MDIIRKKFLTYKTIVTLFSIISIILFLFSLLLLFYVFSNPEYLIYRINPHFNYIDKDFYELWGQQTYYALNFFQNFFYYFLTGLNFLFGLYLLYMLKKKEISNTLVKCFLLGNCFFYFIKLIFIIVLIESKKNSSMYMDTEVYFEIIFIVSFLISYMIFRGETSLNNVSKSFAKSKVLLPLFSISVLFLILYVDLSREKSQEIVSLIPTKINCIVEKKLKMVKVGMNKCEIIRIIGKPFREYSTKNEDSWFYVINTQTFPEKSIDKEMEIYFHEGVCYKIEIINSGPPWL